MTPYAPKQRWTPLIFWFFWIFFGKYIFFPSISTISFIMTASQFSGITDPVITLMVSLFNSFFDFWSFIFSRNFNNFFFVLYRCSAHLLRTRWSVRFIDIRRSRWRFHFLVPLHRFSRSVRTQAHCSRAEFLLFVGLSLSIFDARWRWI